MNKVEHLNQDGFRFDAHPFKLSVITGDTPLNQTLKFNGRHVEVVDNFRRFEATIEVIDCFGLLHLKNVIENLQVNQAIAPAALFEWDWLNFASAEWIPGDEPHFEIGNGDYGVFAHRADLSKLFVFEVSDFNGSAEEAWSMLWSVDSQLADVAYLSVSLPTHGAIHEPTGKSLWRGNGYRFYCVSQPHSDAIDWNYEYSAEFQSRAEMVGLGTQYSKKSWLSPYVSVSAIDCFTFTLETPPTLPPDFSQSEREITLHPGDMLDERLISVMEYSEERAVLNHYQKSLQQRADALDLTPFEIREEFYSEFRDRVAGLCAPEIEAPS